MSNSTKLSAKDRIATLLDDNSFVEIGALVTKRSTDFNLQTKEAPSDGVITGYGTINDCPVYVYSQDASVLNGTIGEMHAKKIAGIYDLALKVGAPVVGILDCGGLRLEESTDALEGLGTIMYKQSLASGVIPQIAVVLGNCGGGLSISASMCDFVFASKDGAKLFINTPDSVKGNNAGKCDTASAAFKAESGVVDYVGETEEDVLNAVRDLVSIIPSCNEDDAPLSDSEDDLNRLTPEFGDLISDPALALVSLSDDGFFLETKKEAAPEMVTGFIKLNGATIGCVANREALMKDGKAEKKFDAAITTGGCKKAVKFVKFCDAFDIPVLTLTNVEGFGADMHQEKSLAMIGAELTATFANTTSPRVNFITGKAIGSAYTMMNSKAIGADLTFALEGAKIGAMSADLAAQIICANDPKADKAKAAADYADLQLSAVYAAKHGYVDTIVSAEEARKNIIYAFEMLYLKSEDRPLKKHGSI